MNINTAVDVRALGGLRVVAYFRMSSDDQQTSIEQQQKEVRQHCRRNGWDIVREYADAGKSGSKEIRKRKEFLRMIADSGTGEFSAVVVYDTSRFGRLDSLDSAEFKNTLRRNRVHLESVKEGRIDWSTSMGRMQDSLLSEANHEYSVKISNTTVRGRLSTVEAGFWPVGEVPFGYDREYWENGELRMTVEREKAFRKPRNWKLKLKVNESEAETIRFLFREFAEKDMSLRQLAKVMNEKGIKGKIKVGWIYSSVGKVLTNRAYIGETTIGYARQSKAALQRITATTIPNSCPAIVDRKLFDQVQRKIAERKTTGRKVKSERASALSGVLYCGRCGYAMEKKERKGVVYFTCSSATRRPESGCHQWRVHESEVLPVICKLLVESVDSEILLQLQAKPADAPKPEIDTLKAEAATLERKIKQGGENLLLAEPSVFPLLQKQLQAWQAELQRLRNTLSLAVESPSGLADWRKWWDGVKGTLVELGEKLGADQRREFQNVPAHVIGEIRSRGGRVTAGEFWRLMGRPSADVGEVLRSLGHLKDGDDIGHVTTDDALPAGSVWFVMRNPFPVTQAEPAVLRSLLHQLRVRLILHWKPNGKRYFSLDYGQLKAEIDVNYVNADSNTRSRVRSRDRG